MKRYIGIVVLLLLILFFNGFSKENKLEKNVRTFVNIMDYISTDYHNSVEKGKVISQSEFTEMNDFIEKAINIFPAISSEDKTIDAEIILKKLNELQNLIRNKKDKKLVSEKSNAIKQIVLSYNLIKISPLQWPSITKGKKVFQANCVSCHGSDGSGDGPLAPKLDPKPANLLNNDLMNSISPFQIYNTIRLGVSGTSMPSFDQINDYDAWNTAFYVSSLRYKKYNLTKDSIKSLFTKSSKLVSLDEAATQPDNLLIDKFFESNVNDTLLLASVRLYKPGNNSKVTLDKASLLLNDALSLYKAGKNNEASDKALSAYLEGIEPYEAQLEAVNSDLKIEIENIMNKVRNDIKSNKSTEILNGDITKAQQLISEAASTLNHKNFSFWFSFFLAASILLREGLEAFLIIITIIGVLKSVNADKATKWVHGGWIVALLLGIVSMFFTNMIIAFGAQSRELMEGIGSLIAVIMLLYIGFWLHSKTEAKKWKDFVENKIIRLVSGNNMFGLAVVSFVVVFREAFESVIFLSAVNLEVDQSNRSGVYLGAVSSIILVLILSWIAIKFAAKLPIRKLFQYSALTMAVLSFVLIGKGIHALQESGYSSVTSIPFKINLSLLGIYPTAETIAAQIFIFVLTLILWQYSKKPSLSKVKN